MSGPGTTDGSTVNAPSETVTVTAAAIKPARLIGTIIADITISEDNADTVTITKKPVEYGAAITDHAYSEPPTISILAKWSNSSIYANGDPDYCKNIYQDLLTMQAQRIPFKIYTPQRRMQNMLILTIAKHTDEKTENALECTLGCSNINLVTVSISALKSNSSQANPAKTGTMLSGGTRQTIPAPSYNSTGGASNIPFASNL